MGLRRALENTALTGATVIGLLSLSAMVGGDWAMVLIGACSYTCYVIGYMRGEACGE